MSNLFYSKTDNFLFWVAGYTKDGNVQDVAQMIEALKENATHFAQIASVPFEHVKTTFLNRSSRYKYMRVFYCTLPVEKVPDEAYVIEGKDWNMWKWLED